MSRSSLWWLPEHPKGRGRVTQLASKRQHGHSCCCVHAPRCPQVPLEYLCVRVLVSQGQPFLIRVVFVPKATRSVGNRASWRSWGHGSAHEQCCWGSSMPSPSRCLDWDSVSSWLRGARFRVQTVITASSPPSVCRHAARLSPGGAT